MTRINLIPPRALADQHLIAEHKEILQLCGQYRKSLNSKRGIYGIPAKFTLGTGHVKFFYDKLMYLHKRFNAVKKEMKRRKFNSFLDFDTSFILKFSHYKDYQPDEEAFHIITTRIIEKITTKESFYTYKGQPFDIKVFIDNYANTKRTWKD